MIKIVAIAVWWIFGYGLIELVLGSKGMSFADLCESCIGETSARDHGVEVVARVTVYFVVPMISVFLILWGFLGGGES